MIRNILDLYTMPIDAVDGEVGLCNDLYVDDRSWQIRYLIIELNHGNNARRILLSPHLLSSFDGIRLNVQLLRKELFDCPDWDSARPVSSYQNEISATYCNMLYKSDGYCDITAPIYLPDRTAMNDSVHLCGWSHHLRSTRELSRYSASAEDGPAGQISGLLLDDRCWAARFLLIKILAGKSEEYRLVNIFWVDTIEWALQSIHLGFIRGYLENFPRYNPSIHCNISYEKLIDLEQTLRVVID